jgi:outer membrane protein assembly factor BamC
VLPARANIEVGRDGPLRWLVIDGTPAQVWEGVRQFLQAQGFELKVQEPAIGIVETQWAERRPDVPEKGIRGALARAVSGFYGTPYRDKFRVRLEPTGDGRTELYLTHYGVEQVVAENNRADSQAVWRLRPSDPELANELLNGLMVYLGVDEGQAASRLAAADAADARARLVDDHAGVPSVLVQDDFARAWRRTGIALDRIGLVVEDRIRAEGIYFVRKVDQVTDAGGKGEGGFFSRLFSRDDGQTAGFEKAQVVVTAEGNNSRITLRTQEGEPLARDAAVAVLQPLAQQLR